jgi:hypothetical protein
VITELQDQLLAREMELDSQEGVVITWEESMTAFSHALEEARAGSDTSCAHAGAAQQDYLTLVSASSSQPKRHKALRRTLDERATLLGLQEMNLVVCEVTLSEELESGLCHPNRHDLLAKLDETRARVHGIAGNQAAEAGRLSR